MKTITRKNGERTALTLLFLLVTSVTAWAAPTGNWADNKAESLVESDDHGTIYITTAEQLALYAYNVNNDVENAKGYYRSLTVELQADIDLSAHKWTPIGNSDTKFFAGKFNGNGHVISGMDITNDCATNYYGFVGYMKGSSNVVYIDNLVFRDCHVTGNITGSGNGGVAIVVGYLASDITYPVLTNCLVMESFVKENYITATHPSHGVFIGLATYDDALQSSNNFFYHTSDLSDVKDDSNLGVTVEFHGEYSLSNLYFQPAFAVTLPNGFTATSTMGIVYNGKFYTCRYSDVTLVAPGTAPLGYVYDYECSDVTITNGTFRMPEKDITISGGNLVNDGQYHSISYVDAFGTELTAQATALDGTENTIAGIYFVGTDITYDHTLTLNAPLTLILCDGCTMNVGTSDAPYNGRGINNNNAALIVYGQSAGSGALSVFTTNNSAIDVKGLTINGGNVTANANGDRAISVNYNVTINGGNVTATANGGDAIFSNDGDIAINGGNVTATATGSNAGIKGDHNITLGWTNYTDRITASSYHGGNATIKTGRKLTDGTNIYDDKTSSATLTALTNKTLSPYGDPALSLANDADNSTAISGANGEARIVTLSGRTFYRDGDWNTLCLPFDATKTGPLDKAIIKELDTEAAYNGHVTGFDGTTLYLNFKDAESIVAGRPCIVKWEVDQTPVINPSDEYAAALGFISEVPTYDDGRPSNWNADGEGPAKLVDGKTTTKYGLSDTDPLVLFHYASPITPKGYALWTADDSEGDRNPMSWTIKAKNSGDDDWTTLTTVDNSDGDKLPMANNQRTVFALDNSTAYQYFWFEATRRWNSVEYQFQLAELQFCTVRPDVTMSDIVNPVFYGVTIDATDPTAVTSGDGKVSFVGSYSPYSITGEDRSILFLGAANTLYYPNAAMTINSCRAHFELNGITAGDPSVGVRAFVLSFGGDNEATGIMSLPADAVDTKDNAAWYTLGGLRLAGKPSAKGIYINGGRKIVIK